MTPPHKWKFDIMSAKSHHHSYSGTVGASLDGVNDPIGMVSPNSSAVSSSGRGDTKSSALPAKKAWDIAKSPMGNLFMMGFMMYMSGSSVQIFSIMITFMAAFTPLKNIFGLKTAFAAVEGEGDFTLQKLAFVAMNMVGIGMAIYKFNALGLLPTEPADWVSWLTVKTPLETSFGH